MFTERQTRGNFDLFTMPLSAGATATPLLASRFNEVGLRFSPDGRAMSFASNESGRPEIYIASPQSPAAKVRVSTGGASQARWSRDGRELYDLSDGKLFIVPVRSIAPLDLGVPTAMFTIDGRGWIDDEPSADGKRFLVVVPEMWSGEQPLTVVMNWTSAIEN